LRQRLLSLLSESLRGAFIARRVRQLQTIDPAHQRARLQKARGAQRLLADEKSRSKTDAAGKFVGF
jgi:hypothetical protein